MDAKRRILIVDDDAALNEALKGLLQHHGYDVTCRETAESALAVFREQAIQLVLLDLRLRGESGLDLLSEMRRTRPEASVILISGSGTIESAVEAMRRGADNFVVKPLEPPRLLTIVAKGLENRALRLKNMQLERITGRKPSSVLGLSRAMREALSLAEVVAPRDTTVLLVGETGTGKGLLARYVHERSPRRKEPFVDLNAAGLQRDLTESELFGHEKGSFTGAMERKLGLFEAAVGGTLFLDEIGEMDLAVQAKLLKAIDEKRFRRIGGITEIETDVRLIAATHRDLHKAVADGHFREDLFYRLNVFTVRLPPLRERPEDIEALARHFLEEWRESGPAPSFSPDALRQLEAYSWPGNVRELRNVIERAAILCPPGSPILPSHLPVTELANSDHRQAPRPAIGARMEEAERDCIERALKAHHGNMKRAALELGISRGTLYRKVRLYNLGR